MVYLLYFVASWLKRYPLEVKYSKLVLMSCLLLTVFGEYVLIWLNRRIGASVGERYLFYNNAPLLFIASVMFFLMFQRLKIHSECLQKLINKLASYSFGVYLLHDNKNMRSLIWGLIRPTRVLDYGLLSSIFLFCLIAISLYLVCSMADVVREKLFAIFGISNLELRVGRRIDHSIQEKIDSIG